jgi:hypothetical protein
VILNAEFSANSIDVEKYARYLIVNEELNQNCKKKSLHCTEIFEV